MKFNIFLSYCKERSPIFFIGLIIVGIIFGVYQLYGLSWDAFEKEAMVYAGILCLIFLMFVLIIDVYRYYKRNDRLYYLTKTIISENDFPEEKVLSGKLYQEIIQQLKENFDQELLQHKKQGDDLEDVVTLWGHQIKLPISALQLVLETEDQPDKKVLRSQLFLIDQYTDMMLAYLRMQSETTDYVFRYYDLDDMVRQVIRKFSTSFIQKKLQLDFKETHQKVLTDEKWLVFVLEQVLSNALKYTSSGKISIYSSSNQVLVIEDTGIGIDASDLPRIFEKGYTGNNGRQDKKASGLGLYLCKRVINHLHHQIRVESSIGVGTKVFIDLRHKEFDIE